MNIKELLGKDSKELEALSDAQLLEYFSPYMKFIVPVETKEEKSSNGIVKNKQVKHYASNEAQKTMDMAQLIAKKLGIKV